MLAERRVNVSVQAAVSISRFFYSCGIIALSSADDRKQAIKLPLWLQWRNIPFFKGEYSTADVRRAILPPQLSLAFEFCSSSLPSALRQLPLCWPASKRMADSSEWVFNFTCLTMFPANNLQCQAKASGQGGPEPGTWSTGGGTCSPSAC